MEKSFNQKLITEAKRLLIKLALGALLMFCYWLMLVGYCYGMVYLDTRFPDIRYLDALGLLGLGYIVISSMIYIGKIIDKD
jgi:hypothetical protein